MVPIAHKRFDEQDLSDLPSLPARPAGRADPDEVEASDEDDDEVAPEAVSLSAGRRTTRQRDREAQELASQSARARKAANKALDAKLKAAASTRPAKRKRAEVDPAPQLGLPPVASSSSAPPAKSKRLDVETSGPALPATATPRLPAAVFEAASAAFEEAKRTHATTRTQATKATLKRKVKRKKMAKVVNEGAAKEIKRSNIVVQHLANGTARNASAAPPRPLAAEVVPSEAKRRFLRDKLLKKERIGTIPSKNEPARRPAHLESTFAIRRKAPAFGFARSLRMGQA